MSPPPPPSTPLAARLWLAVLLLALAAITVARSFAVEAFNHDIGWVLYCGGAVLDGARLSEDLLLNNPPLTFWIAAAVVAVARSVGAAPLLIHNLLLLALVLLAVWAAARARTPRPSEPPGTGAVRAGAWAAALLLLPGYHFGQREHLFAVLYLPYVCAAARALDGRPVGAPLAVLVGVGAGVGIAIKPFFVLPWLATEILVAVVRGWRGWLRVECLGVAVLQLGFAAVVLLGTSYLTAVGVAMQAYDAYNVPLRWLTVATVLLGLAVIAGLVVRPTTADRMLRRVLLLNAIVALAVVVIQRKGFSYHYVPAALFSAALLVVVGLGLRFGAGGRGAVLAVALATSGYVVALGAGWIQRWPGAIAPRVVAQLAEVVAREAGDRPVMFLSSSVSPAFPVVNLAQVKWAGRVPNLWVLPGVYRDDRRAQPFPYRALDDMPAHERRFSEQIVDDLVARRPRLLVVHRFGYKQGFGVTTFDYLAYFARFPRFAAWFADFELLTTVGQYDVYRDRGE